jgi:hypothetical protein
MGRDVWAGLYVGGIKVNTPEGATERRIVETRKDADVLAELKEAKEDRDVLIEILKMQAIVLSGDVGVYKLFYSESRNRWLAVNRITDEYVTDGDGLRMWETAPEAYRELCPEPTGDGGRGLDT